MMFEDGVFEDVSSYDQLQKVNPAAIQAAGNKLRLNIREEFLDKVVFRAIESVNGQWQVSPNQAWSWNAVDKCLKNIAAAAGYYGRVTFFCLRRLAATAMHMAALSPGAITAAMGHRPGSTMYLKR